MIKDCLMTYSRLQKKIATDDFVSVKDTEEVVFADNRCMSLASSFNTDRCIYVSKIMNTQAHVGCLAMHRASENSDQPKESIIGTTFDMF